MLNFKRGDRLLYLLFWFIQLCAVGLSLYSHQCGFLVTYDSVEYLAAAHSFRENSVLLGSDGTPFVYWPPLFPILLSFFDNPLDGLFWINMACQLLIGLAIFKLGTALLEAFAFRVVFMVSSLLSVHLIMATVFVWSDLIFVCFALWNFYFACRLIQNQTYWIFLLSTGFLMCLQRNAGIFWITPTCFWLFLNLPFNWKARTVFSSAAFLVMTSGFWYWNLSHPIQIMTGFNKLGIDTVLQLVNNLYLIGIALGKLYFPANGLVGFCLFVTILLASLYFLKEQFISRKPLQLLVLILITYSLCFMFYDHLDPNDLDRYFFPLVPIAYLFTWMATAIWNMRLPMQAQMITRGLVLIWLFYPIVRTINNALLWHNMSC
jgi:hypothetical protein